LRRRDGVVKVKGEVGREWRRRRRRRGSDIDDFRAESESTRLLFGRDAQRFGVVDGEMVQYKCA